MMKSLYMVCIFVSYIEFYVSIPVEKESKEQIDNLYNLDGLDKKRAQEKEYFRYLSQVITELETDPAFEEKIKNITEEDVTSGNAAHLYDLVGHNARKKLDEVKRMEVEYQRELIRQEKHHMLEKGINYWNPVHHDNKDTFEKEDFRKLLEKHTSIMAEETKKGHEEFKKYEMEKEHKRQEAMKKMIAEEKVIAEKEHHALHHKPHKKLHQPGHKAQLEEVWEKEDGLDPESFDPKTFFNLHDKNGDGYLDHFELETFLLNDLDKAYNESDPETDLTERAEDMVQMREYMTKTMDTDKDGLVSMEEFMIASNRDEFQEDKEWKPLKEDEQFTKDEFAEYERSLDAADKTRSS